MAHLEKTVFISYRRTNAPWALALFQDLMSHGFDVFLDYNGIASGDFEQVIVGNIRARAHFLVLLTPSALERCTDRSDWFRREIETALTTKRNIVPIMLEGFNFDTPGIGAQLTGSLAELKQYNALRIPVDYFGEAMERLREKFLNVPLDAVLHPTSRPANLAAEVQQAAAQTAEVVSKEELTSQEWYERGCEAIQADEKIRCYDEAIRIDPDSSVAFNNRGLARASKGDLAGALEDYGRAIQIDPNNAFPFNNRAKAREKSDLDGALEDYNHAIQLMPEFATAINNRGMARMKKKDFKGALEDVNEAIRLDPKKNHYDCLATIQLRRGNLIGFLSASWSILSAPGKLNPD
jgi:tetratricopeptide (TPR) repeat protein